MEVPSSVEKMEKGKPKTMNGGNHEVCKKEPK